MMIPLLIRMLIPLLTVQTILNLAALYDLVGPCWSFQWFEMSLQHTAVRMVLQIQAQLQEQPRRCYHWKVDHGPSTADPQAVKISFKPECFFKTYFRVYHMTHVD